MGSHAQDSGTQKAASTGAQAQDAQLAANAAQNQQFANTARSTLFGTYNPATNQYSGGTESQYLNPSSQDTKGLTGAYANLYDTQANTTAQGAKDAVGTSQMMAAERGLGSTPNGYTADQMRQAYQTQAGQNAGNYATDFGGQHAEDVQNFQNASNMLNAQSSDAAHNSLAGNTSAAGNYSSLYGTASQQVNNPWAMAAGSIAGLGSAASGFMPKPGCWVAAEIFGGWHEPRTVLVREWMHTRLSRTLPGALVVRAYVRYGETLAAMVRSNRALRLVVAPVFYLALKCAEVAQAKGGR